MGSANARDGGEKRALRQWALRQRALRLHTAPESLGADNAQLADRLERLPAYATARVLAGYLPLPGECSPMVLMQRAAARGVDVLVPAWNAVARRYAFCRWSPGGALRPGPFQVPEPERKVWIAPSRIDLVLVPGLVFDRRGGRIGFGAGHYDRLLPRLGPRAVRVGVACPWQVLKRVPVDPHDVPLHCLVTTRGIVSARP